MIEEKNLIGFVITKIKEILDLNPIKNKVDELIRKYYNKGMEQTEVKFNMNFIPDDREIDFLQDYVHNNLQQHTDALGEELRQEIQRGILNKEKTSELKKRIKDKFKDGKYTNRLKTVLRTESLRAGNMAQMNAAKQVPGTVLKWVDVVGDNNTSPICLAMSKKYGSEEKAINLDEKFKVKGKGFDVSELQPPFHPNCRTVIRFVRNKK